MGALTVTYLGVLVAVQRGRMTPNENSAAIFIYLAGSMWPWAAVVVGLVAAWRFARKPARLIEGAVLMLCLIVNEEAYAAGRGWHGHNVFFLGAALFGWLSGLAAARLAGLQQRQGLAAAELFAEYGAVGAIGAIYTMAGMTKLAAQSWIMPSGDNLRPIVLAHTWVDGQGLMAWYGNMVGNHGALADLMMLGVVLIEGLGVMYLFGERMRLLWGSLFIFFHVNAFFLLHIFYPEPIIIVASLTYPWPRLFSKLQRPSFVDPQAGLEHKQTFRALAIVAGVLMLLALIATLHPYYGYPMPKG